MWLKSGRSNQPIVDEKYNHLKEAALQRKELLDRLKHEQQLSRQILRPRSNPGDEVTPRQRQSRRTESQPQLTESRRHGEMNYYPVRLQPIEHAPLPPPVLPPVPSYQLPVSTFQVMQPYQVVPPQIMSQQQPASNSRSDMYEMMMMQNAQMHQMIMQQLMLNSIQPRLNQNSTSSCSNNDRDKMLALDLDDIRKLLKTPRESRRPHVYPDYRYSHPYAGLPPLVPTYHRPMEPIPVPALVVPGNVQSSTNIHAAEGLSQLKANYLRQQNELDDEVPA